METIKRNTDFSHKIGKEFRTLEDFFKAMSQLDELKLRLLEELAAKEQELKLLEENALFEIL